MKLKHVKKGFLLTECLIGITVLALLAVFIFPAFQNMWMNAVKADQELTLLFHSQNLAEDMMALYNADSTPVAALEYHGLDMVAIIEKIELLKIGEKMQESFLSNGHAFIWQLKILDKNANGILCRSELRFDFMKAGFQLEFMLSVLGV